MMRAVLIVMAAVGVAGCAKSGMGADVRADITTQMQSASDPIQACYAEALKRDRKLRGRIELDMTAAPSTGEFVDVRVVRDEVGDPTMRQCVIEAVGVLRLAKPQSTKLAIRYPIDFAPTK